MNSEVLEKLRDFYGVHWIGIKFYSSTKNPEPLDAQNENLSKIKEFPSAEKKYRFCEALDEAVSHPICLNSDNLSCDRAKFVFGWSFENKNEIMESCQTKMGLSNEEVKNLFYNFSKLNKNIESVGLNTSEFPDLAIAYLNPGVAMRIIRKYNRNNSENIDVSISSVMSICGSLVVRSYMEDKITLSFGCEDSRRYSNIDRDRLAICLPQRVFRTFLPSRYNTEQITVLE